jgi:transcription elongation GreA/GreB family factor
MSILKQQLHHQCLQIVDSKIGDLQQAIHAIQSDAREETKSSAGDKYETGRAMMQIEVEKLSVQLGEFVKSRKVLDTIDPLKTLSVIQLGSLVITGSGNYYVSISAGTMRADGRDFFCISPASPIGALLIGKKSGDEFSFRNQKINILEVF